MPTSFALMIVLSLSSFGAEIFGGPYTVSVSAARGTASVCWVSAEARVSLDPPPPANPAPSGPAPVLRSSCADFARLKPNQVYHYKIDALGASGEGEFRTPPAGPEPFRFVVFGDTQQRLDLQKQMAPLIASTQPHLALHTGDIVSEGLRSEDWGRFFQLWEPLLRHTAFFPAMGNHDRNDPKFYELFRLRRPFYSFDWGQAHFTVLYSDLDYFSSPREKEAFLAEQDEWLAADLAAARDKAWRFVLFHHPPYSAHEGRLLDPHRTLLWVPLFEKHKVQAVFSGHEHDYQHHVSQGVHYIVSGGAGGNLSKPNAPLPITKKFMSIENFVQADVSAAELKITILGLGRAVLDEFIVKP